MKLCRTVPSVSTGATCRGSSLGCKMLLLYVFFDGRLLQAFPAGALLSSSLHTAFLPILAFLHPNWVFCAPFVFSAGVLIIHPRSETSPAGF